MRIIAPILAAILAFAVGWFTRGAVIPTPTNAHNDQAAAPTTTTPTDRANNTAPSTYVGPDAHVAKPVNPDTPFLDIRTARYGYGDRWADVTGACRNLIRGETLTLPMNLHRAMGVDPAPGFMKYVELVVAINGADVHLAIADSLQLTSLRLSSPADAAAATPPPDAAHPTGPARP